MEVQLHWCLLKAQILEKGSESLNIFTKWLSNFLEQLVTLGVAA